MSTPDWVVCQAFIQKAAHKKALLSLFPPSNHQLMQPYVPSLSPVEEGVSPYENRLDELHYSWFAHLLRSLPKNEIGFFLSILNEAQVNGLKKMLLFREKSVDLTSLAKRFFQEKLFEMVADKPILAPELIPQRGLALLLSLSFFRLVQLIDFLGLYDLRREMQKIIQVAQLRKIEQMLSEQEKLFMKSLPPQRERGVFSKMGLDRWEGDEKALRVLIHQRGLSRLACALYGESESLIWYVQHKLDTGRGTLLAKLVKKSVQKETAKLIIDQIGYVLNFIQSKE